jgi:hypothetical protein
MALNDALLPFALRRPRTAMQTVPTFERMTTKRDLDHKWCVINVP